MVIINAQLWNSKTVEMVNYIHQMITLGLQVKVIRVHDLFQYIDLKNEFGTTVIIKD